MESGETKLWGQADKSVERKEIDELLVVEYGEVEG